MSQFNLLNILTKDLYIRNIRKSCKNRKIFIIRQNSLMLYQIDFFYQIIYNDTYIHTVSTIYLVHHHDKYGVISNILYKRRDIH